MPNETQNSGPIKRVLVTFFLGVLCTVGAYFVGASQANARVSQMQTQLSAAQNENERVVQFGMETATKRKARADFADGINSIYRANLALDRRNFGIANERIREASRLIAAGRPSLNAADAIYLIEKELENVNVTVAPNLEEQRANLMQIAGQLELIARQMREEHEKPETSGN